MVTRMRRRRSFSTPFVVLLIIVVAVIIAHIFIDRLYGVKIHSALGYGAVYEKNMWFELATRYLGAALYAAIALFAIRPIQSIVPRPAYRGMQLLLVVIGWFVGFAMWSLNPTAWFLFFNHKPFTYSDPLQHVNAAFYVYNLPLLMGLFGRVIGTLVLWIAVRLMATLAAFVQQQMQITRPGFARLVRSQARGLLLVLGTILVLLAGLTYLNRYETILTSGNGSFVYGPDFVTARLTLPVFSWLHIATLLLTAAAVFWQASHIDDVLPERDGFALPSWRSFRRPIFAFGLYIASLIVTGVIGSLVNTLYVHPNQNTVELPYIKDTIDATRYALGVENVHTMPINPVDNLSAADVASHQDALDNVRVNDQGQTTSIYNQLQSFKNYFTFSNAAVDRYDNKEVYISARQMDVTKLPVQTWVNQTLIYTHGYGIAASPVNRFDANGLPIFWAQNTPQQVTPPIPQITRPQIYFGLMNNNVIAPSKQPEFDYPVGNTQHTSHYKGGYGLPIVGNRLLLAIEQGSLKFYTSDQITNKSEWLFDRNIYQRVEDIAPFLTYDKDAYPFVDQNGHIKWILDAYTETPNIPYAQQFMNTAYIRNSVKVVMDAYTGKTTFYVVDKNDPMLKSLAAAYPSLFTYHIPADIAAHFRYPVDLFQAQADALTRYHMTNPSSFYNQDDLWQVAQQIYNQNQKQARPPVYQMVQMPGQTKPQFVLSELFTPQTKDNLNGWLIADNSPGDYGKLTLYQFPQSSLVFGPMQAENQIDANPFISQELSLWNQQGSHVVRGNLLLIPVGNSLMYVEPVYLVANRSNSLPQLERVIIDYNEKVYMNDSLGAALQDVLNGNTASLSTGGTTGGQTATGTGQSGGQTNQTGQGTTSPSAGNAPSSGTQTLRKMTIQQLITMANNLFEQYQQDTAAGRLDKAGQDLSSLRSVLSTLQSKGGTTGNAIGSAAGNTP
ncbi:UPF0182 family protein [Alicyclobacillus mengziensis]|uniref:UPF0182 family protein n=1 Tax=Alicyclobacillus mengziensis TaxID=2931921 RepID=A0A9X7Z705_9BACL|nr:UPF0182 family protein [Alicyclobacillus mengziensis]QSO47897.1 UPF0182 family protein [Alicyclobacillus mengziensis]